MYHDDNCWGSLIGSLFIGGLCYYSEQTGKMMAHKEMAEKKKEDEISELKRQVEELKRKLS